MANIGRLQGYSKDSAPQANVKLAMGFGSICHVEWMDMDGNALSMKIVFYLALGTNIDTPVTDANTTAG